MNPDLIQPIVTIASVFGAFLWLRHDIKNLRNETRSDMRPLRTDMQDDMQQLRADMQREMQQLRSDVRDDMQQFRSDIQRDMQQFRTDIQDDTRRLEQKVDGLDSRLRAVESEQSRVAGLLEGLALAGTLPGDESQ